MTFKLQKTNTKKTIFRKAYKVQKSESISINVKYIIMDEIYKNGLNWRIKNYDNFR